MDSDVLKTFLEVARTRHFGRAAGNLFVTQAAVSARIRQLENIIGQQLFTRTRNNIQLTAAGRRLMPYAENIVATWSRALLDTALEDPSQPLVVAGILPTLRETFLHGWLLDLLANDPAWVLQFHSHDSAEMVARIREGSLDAGLMYEPPRAADLWTESLFSFELVLVSTQGEAQATESLNDYIHVDWGTSFSVAYGAELGRLATPRLYVDSPGLAIDLILTRGGAAYLARPMVDEYIATQRLYLVQDAPAVTRAVHLVAGREVRNTDWFAQFHGALRRVAAVSAD